MLLRLLLLALLVLPSAGHALAAAPESRGTSEAKVRRMLAADGFSNIASLHRNFDGSWSGLALRNGVTVRVDVNRSGEISLR